MASRRQGYSAVAWLDQAAGGVLSWVTGTTTARRGGSQVDAAIGELLSWTGLIKEDRRRARPADRRDR